MIRVMDWIAVRAHNQDQFDYAKTLGSLVTEYEISQKRRTKSQLAALELLKAVAESSGMTQAELAKVLDIEQGTASKIMSGARSITPDHAKRVARRFKMRPEAFLDLE
jgi:antitoxin component HigA of HigAB toxin-antitoxin module